ncbi:hypothetical protein NUH87_31095 [Pseudomonas batumici]|uniref:hypothetical protein n=1 Tax=Pseudomonas batumici TaxID=226910 RepID=UPI0030D567DD
MTTIGNRCDVGQVGYIESSSAEKVGSKKSGSNIFRSAFKGILNLFCCRTPRNVRKAQAYYHASRTFNTSLVGSRGNTKKNELQISTAVTARPAAGAIGKKGNTTIATGVKTSVQMAEGENWMGIKTEVARKPTGSMSAEISNNRNPRATVAKKTTSEQEKNRKEDSINRLKEELKWFESQQKTYGGYEGHIKRHKQFIALESKVK